MTLDEEIVMAIHDYVHLCEDAVHHDSLVRQCKDNAHLVYLKIEELKRRKRVQEQ